MSKKRLLVDLILSVLEQELSSIVTSAKAAHDAATHEESKAEDSHDTRGLEASYLAGAQMARIESLKKVITTYRFTEFRDFKTTDLIDVGAVVELELKDKRVHYFLVGQGGGITVSLEGKTIQVINIQAPLGEALLGRRIGETLEVEGHRGSREYEVISIF